MRDDGAARLVPVPGGHLAVDDQGDGEPVVLLHGAGQNLCAWEPLTPLLPDGIRVVRYDLRGHGRSARLTQNSFAQHTKDLDLLIEALRLERPVIVGFSLGAWIGLRYATGSSTVGGFVSVDGPLAAHEEVFRRSGSQLPSLDEMREEFEADHFVGSENEVKRLLESLGVLGTASEPEARRTFAPRPDRLLERRPAPDERMCHQRALRAERPLDHFGKLTCPATLIVASDPWPEAPAVLRTVRAELVEELLRVNPAVQVTWVDSQHDILAGHANLVAGAVARHCMGL